MRKEGAVVNDAVDLIYFEKPIWKRQFGEPEKSYAAFEIYLDIGETQTRTISEVAKRFDMSAPSLSKAAKKWQWEQRALAFDNEMQERKILAKEDALQKMYERHAQNAQALLSKAMDGLTEIDISKLSPSHICRFITHGMEMEQNAALGNLRVDYQRAAKQKQEAEFERLKQIIATTETEEANEAEKRKQAHLREILAIESAKAMGIPDAAGNRPLENVQQKAIETILKVNGLLDGDGNKQEVNVAPVIIYDDYKDNGEEDARTESIEPE